MKSFALVGNPNCGKTTLTLDLIANYQKLEDAKTVMYVDYEYFQQLYAGKSGNDPLDPNTLYVKTDSEETTKIINEYLASTGKYNGSIEDQLAGMFSSMTKTNFPTLQKYKIKSENQVRFPLFTIL